MRSAVPGKMRAAVWRVERLLGTSCLWQVCSHWYTLLLHLLNHLQELHLYRVLNSLNTHTKLIVYIRTCVLGVIVIVLWFYGMFLYFGIIKTNCTYDSVIIIFKFELVFQDITFTFSKNNIISELRLLGVSCNQLNY